MAKILQNQIYFGILTVIYMQFVTNIDNISAKLFFTVCSVVTMIIFTIYSFKNVDPV